MTDDTKAGVKPAAKPEANAFPGRSFIFAFASILAGSAIASGLAGLALHRGFGLSLPFMAGWLLLIAVLFFLRQVALTVAGAWYEMATAKAGEIAARSVIGATVAAVELEAMGVK